MRIAIFSEVFLPKVDGIVNTICQLLQHLERRGITGLLFAPAGGPPEYAGTRVVGLGAVHFPLYPELKLAPPLGGLRQPFQEFRPDLVHLVNPVSLGWGGLWLARQAGLPVVASYHTDVAGFATRWGLGWMSPAIWGYLRAVHAQADLNLAPSHFTRGELAANGFPNVQVWSRGVDAERFTPDRRSPAWRARLTGGHPEAPLLLYVGRLSPEKRVDWLLDVLKALPGARLGIVGAGPHRPALESLFAGAPVVFTGALYGDDLAAAYASADVFVFPGANETFGNVVLEAMASGLPVVAPNSGGVVDFVRHGCTGLLFAPEDRGALSAQVRALVEDPAQAASLGREARRFARSRNWETVFDGLIEDYSALVQRPRRRTPWAGLNRWPWPPPEHRRAET